jgi:hypothetical protein
MVQVEEVPAWSIFLYFSLRFGGGMAGSESGGAGRHHGASARIWGGEGMEEEEEGRPARRVCTPRVAPRSLARPESRRSMWRDLPGHVSAHVAPSRRAGQHGKAIAPHAAARHAYWSRQRPWRDQKGLFLEF